MNRDEIYNILNEERDYQTEKWGSLQERPHEVGGWLTVMRYLLTKAEAEWSTADGDVSTLDQIRKLAATSVACMEQHGAVRRNLTKGN